MDDRSTLLNQLKIDRDESPRDSGAWRWIAATLLLIGLGGGAAWYLVSRPLPPQIQVAVARSLQSEAPVARASSLDASGYVIARRQATVSSKITGRVVEVLIEEGQEVAAGEIVARLDDANARSRLAQNEALLAQQYANLEAAEVALDNATPIFDRARRQFELGVTSEQDFDLARSEYDRIRTSLEVARSAIGVAEANLALARQDLSDTIVRAPFAGVVTVKAAQEGEMVSPVSAGGGFTRTGIGTIVDMDSLEVEVDVSENFINRVATGQDVNVMLNAYPDWTIPASVIAIIPTADRAKATVRVRVGFRGRDRRVLPQMGARVAFLAPDDGSVAAPVQRLVVVPAEAVSGSGDTATVYVVRNEIVERRAVRLGGKVADGGQIILSGLLSGTEVAIADFSALADGTRVRVDGPAGSL